MRLAKWKVEIRKAFLFDLFSCLIILTMPIGEVINKRSIYYVRSIITHHQRQMIKRQKQAALHCRCYKAAYNEGWWSDPARHDYEPPFTTLTAGNNTKLMCTKKSQMADTETSD